MTYSIGRLRDEQPEDYAQGRADAREDHANDEPIYPVLARRRAYEFAARAADPQCWKPEAVAGNAAWWLGYADQMTEILS